MQQARYDCVFWKSEWCFIIIISHAALSFTSHWKMQSKYQIVHIGMILPACFRLYSRSSLVLSGPSILPQPAKGTTMAVALSSPPSSSEKARMRSAAAFGSGDPLARSTISSSESSEEIPSDTSTANAQYFPTGGFGLTKSWGRDQNSHLQEVSTEPRVLELSQIFYSEGRQD